MWRHCPQTDRLHRFHRNRFPTSDPTFWHAMNTPHLSQTPHPPHMHAERHTALLYLSGTTRKVPTRSVFRDQCHCYLICAHYVFHGGGGYVGYIRKALEKGYLEHPGSACCTDGMLEIFVLFGHCLCCLDVSKWLAGAYKSSDNHLDHQRQPVSIRDDRIKWLDFGQTPDPENLEAHPGFVWVKSGYSEAIAWRKVQLTKQ